MHPLTLPGDSFCQTPAIYAWADAYPASVELDLIDVDNDGRLILAARATQAGVFGWDYEYALYNMNSDRAVGSFELTFYDPEGDAAGPVVRCNRIGFHDVNHHSDEIWDGTDWTWSTTPCTTNVPMTTLKWETVPYATDPNANALRWGTLYNFRLPINERPEFRRDQGDDRAIQAAWDEYDVFGDGSSVLRKCGPLDRNSKAPRRYTEDRPFILSLPHDLCPRSLRMG